MIISQTSHLIKYLDYTFTSPLEQIADNETVVIEVTITENKITIEP